MKTIGEEDNHSEVEDNRKPNTSATKRKVINQFYPTNENDNVSGKYLLTLFYRDGYKCAEPSSSRNSS